VEGPPIPKGPSALATRSLGREEAVLLSEQYLVAFASGFRLSTAERDAVRVHLSHTAEPEIR
jgi:hypothetical protein